MGGAASAEKAAKVDEPRPRVIQVEATGTSVEKQIIEAATRVKKSPHGKKGVRSASCDPFTSESSVPVSDTTSDQLRSLAIGQRGYRSEQRDYDSTLAALHQQQDTKWITATVANSMGRKESLENLISRPQNLTSKHSAPAASQQHFSSPPRATRPQASFISPPQNLLHHSRSPSTIRGSANLGGRSSEKINPSHQIIFAPSDFPIPTARRPIPPDFGVADNFNSSDTNSRPFTSRSIMSPSGVRRTPASNVDFGNPLRSRGRISQQKSVSPSTARSSVHPNDGVTPKPGVRHAPDRGSRSRSRSRSRSNSGTNTNADNSEKVTPSNVVIALSARRPPWSGRRHRQNHSADYSTDSMSRHMMRRSPSLSGGGSSYSCDEYDGYGAIFTDNAGLQSTSTKPSVIPPLHLNTHSSQKSIVSPFFSRVIGMGLAPQGLRIITNAGNTAPNEHATVTPSAESVLNSRSVGPGSHRMSNQTPTGTHGRPTPTNLGNHLFEVKETKDVKRNRAKLPPTMTHAKPTTGDWLKKRYIVNNYILLDTLGTGSYGEVRLCKDRTTDNLFAIKIISKEMLKKRKSGNTTETYFEDIRREIAIMKKLLHPNVLRLYEVLDDPNVNKMYLVLEYMKKGDLVNVLKGRESNTPGNGGNKNMGGHTVLSDLELWNIFRQIVAGVRYLHYQNVVHGDIKPQNLLVGENGIVKIADFGISKMLSNSDEQLGNAAGTPAFMSPELCAAEAFSGQLADIWALGATIFMLKYGHPPFVAGNLLNLYNKIQKDPLVFPAQTKINPGLQDLLENMLRKDPNQRFTLDKVILHPWMRYPPPNPATAAALAAAAIACVDRGDIPAVTIKNPNLNMSFKPRMKALAQSVVGSAIDVIAPIRVQFTPPESYNDEEAAAMGKPVKGVNDEEMYQSIGLSMRGKSKNLKIKPRSSSASSSCVSEKEEVTDKKTEKMEIMEKMEDGDMMLSGWGADVFEMVDASANSDSEDDSDDAVDVIVENTQPVTAVNSFKLNSKGVDECSRSISGEVDNLFTDYNVDVSCRSSMSDGSSDEEDNTLKIGNKEMTAKNNISNMSSMTNKHNKISETLSSIGRSDTNDELSSRGSMGKDEETLRSSRFRSQLSKRSVKEALSKEMRSKKNILECPSSERSSQVSSPTQGNSPSSNKYRHNKKFPPGILSTPSNNVRTDRSVDFTRSGDGDDEVDCPLSIEEFRMMMDTLATNGDSMERTSHGSEERPVELVLDTLDFSSQLMNAYNGVGLAYHSEKGQRDFQEDRCCLIPDVAEMHIRELIEQQQKEEGGGFGGGNGGLKSRRGSFPTTAQKDKEALLHKISITCLFDGHSGSVCSEFLSRNFPKMLTNHERFLDKSPEFALIDVCRVIDGKVCDHLIEDDDLSGSTGVIVVYDGRRNVLTVANVGDSMCVLSRGGRAVNMHRMHRLDDAEERARVEAAGGTVIKNRVNGVLAVSRAFGDTRFKDTDSWKEMHDGISTGPVIALPDVYSELCTTLTEFCIIATDGLWDVMSPQLAVNFVRTKLSEKCDLQVCARELVNDAIRNKGSEDNVTVAILSFHTIGEKQI